MGPVVHDLWDDVGGQARAAVQGVRERRAMLSLVRANIAGLKNRFKVIAPVCITELIGGRDRERSVSVLAAQLLAQDLAALRDYEGGTAVSGVVAS